MNAARPLDRRHYPAPMRSVANLRRQQHNCRSCRGEEHRNCLSCEGSGKIYGDFAPVDALAKAVFVCQHGLGTSYRYPNFGAARVAARVASLRGRPLSKLASAERRIRADVEFADDPLYNMAKRDCEAAIRHTAPLNTLFDSIFGRAA